MRDTVGHLGASDISKQVILRHGDSHIQGVLQNITHDVEKFTERTVSGDSVVYYAVSTTLDISGVVVNGLRADTPISTVPVDA